MPRSTEGGSRPVLKAITVIFGLDVIINHAAEKLAVDIGYPASAGMAASGFAASAGALAASDEGAKGSVSGAGRFGSVTAPSRPGRPGPAAGPLPRPRAWRPPPWRPRQGRGLRRMAAEFPAGDGLRRARMGRFAPAVRETPHGKGRSRRSPPQVLGPETLPARLPRPANCPQSQ